MDVKKKLAGPHYLYPLPDAIGIQQTRELYQQRFGIEITEDEAADVLGRVMRYIYLVSTLPEAKMNEVEDAAPTIAEWASTVRIAL